MKASRILITGGVSGIGLAIAENFAAAGASLVVGGLMPAPQARAVTDHLMVQGAHAVYFDGRDIGDGRTARLIAGQAIERLGGLDILVNNAGMQHVAPLEAFPHEKWDQILAINLSAAFHMSAVSLPQMRMQKFGRMINIASVHGLAASPFKSAYVAAKHGLIGLTKTIALEIAEAAGEENITCNAICPGFVRTPLVESQIQTHAQKTGLDAQAAGRDMIKDKHPTGQFITGEQIADMVEFLTRPESSTITGTAFNLDAGWLAR